MTFDPYYVIVTGIRNVIYFGGGGGGAPGGGYDTSVNPDLGIEGPPPPLVAIVNNIGNCSSAAGMAVKVAGLITGDSLSGPSAPLVSANGRTWRDVEFGSTIVRMSGGRFGTIGDAIFSSDNSERNSLPQDAYADVVGVVHNHSGYSADPFANAISYPSYYPDGSGDWAALEEYRKLMMGISAVPDPSLFIIDPRGIVREFKLSEKAYFIGLTDEQKRAGIGLAGRERTDRCN